MTQIYVSSGIVYQFFIPLFLIISLIFILRYNLNDKRWPSWNSDLGAGFRRSNHFSSSWVNFCFFAFRLALAWVLAFDMNSLISVILVFVLSVFNHYAHFNYGLYQSYFSFIVMLICKFMEAMGFGLLLVFAIWKFENYTQVALGWIYISYMAICAVVIFTCSIAKIFHEEKNLKIEEKKMEIEARQNETIAR